MKIRRVFYNHHFVYDKKVIKKQEDFPELTSCKECIDILHRRLGYPPTGKYNDFQIVSFAEVISSTIAEDHREPEPIIESPKHYGTDLLLPAKDWAELQTKAPKKPKKAKII